MPFLCITLSFDPGQHKEIYLLLALTTPLILRSMGSPLAERTIRLQALLIPLPTRRHRIVSHRHQKVT
jgi:hypothetical protein